MYNLNIMYKLSLYKDSNWHIKKSYTNWELVVYELNFDKEKTASVVIMRKKGKANHKWLPQNPQTRIYLDN